MNRRPLTYLGSLGVGLAGSITGGRNQKISGKVKMVDLTIENGTAITEDGSLYMWGSNTYGRLGIGLSSDDLKSSLIPIKIMDNVKSVKTGYHSMALKNDGSLYEWGQITYRSESGGYSSKHELTPTKIMENVECFDSYGGSYAVIKEDGGLYTWGNNSDDILGNGTENGSYVSTPVKILDNVDSVRLNGVYGNFAITKDGGLYVWGKYVHFPYENTYKNPCLTPTKVMDNVVYADVDGFSVYAAITKDGSLYTWGSDGACGYIGNGSYNNLTKEPVKILDNVKSVSLGREGNAAITKDNSLYIWGKDVAHLNDTTYKPTKVMDDVCYANFNCTYKLQGDRSKWPYRYTRALVKTDGSLYIWGHNNGQIGNGTTEYVSTPIKINTSTSNLSTILNTRKLSLLSDEPAKEAGGEKSYTDLKPNTIYNFYSLKTRNTETPLSGDNILYVGQYVSDENGNLNISYQPKEEYADAVTLLTTAATTDISGAKVTVPDIVCNGEEQLAQPTVTLDGVTLTEGIDYDVQKDFSTSVPGDFEIIISGTGDYSGKVTASYKATCAHNYVDGVCTICGDTAGFVKGDANGNGKLDISDARWIASMRAKREELTVEKYPAADFNEDGSITIKDAVEIAKYLVNNRFKTAS